jgi:hypothetical protein
MSNPTKQKKRPSIDDKVKLKLWVKSGGRCQYRNCNQILFEDRLTYADLNTAYIAHIYGYAPNSARYDMIKSPQFEKDFSNLMLLCDACHRKIDGAEKDNHPASLLLEMKKEHEGRIEYLTGIKENVRTNMVLYNAKIGKFNPPMEQETIRQLLANKNRYPFKDTIVLGPETTVIEDGEGLYWQYESRSLETFFAKNLQPLLVSSEQHLSLFPFAPMPLLIKLGSLLGNMHSVTTYQYHREPQGWQWSDTGDEINFQLIEPDKKTGKAVLNISLSGVIADSRIHETLADEEVSIWTLTIDNPRLDFLKTEEILSKFRVIARDTFGRIKNAHGHDSEIHVFPAMPISAAVEFGRAWMPKVDLPMVLYDGREKFMRTIEIKRN